MPNATYRALTCMEVRLPLQTQIPLSVGSGLGLGLLSVDKNALGPSGDQNQFLAQIPRHSITKRQILSRTNGTKRHV
jgi:hypothetical protein